MSALFSKPKVPAPVAPPAPAPTPVVDKDAVAQDAAERLRRRRGRFSTMLAPESGVSPTVGTAMPIGM